MCQDLGQTHSTIPSSSTLITLMTYHTSTVAQSIAKQMLFVAIMLVWLAYLGAHVFISAFVEALGVLDQQWH